MSSHYFLGDKYPSHIPPTVHTLAVITNFLLIYECELLHLDSLLNSGSIGLFKVDPPLINDEEYTGGCIEVSQEKFEELQLDDKAWKCARVCSVMGLCFGALLFVLIFFKQCIRPLPCSQQLMDLSSMMVQVSLALVYVIWMSDACDLYICSHGDGATLLILTQVFWLCGGCFTRCMRDGRYERRDEIAAEKARKNEEKKKVAADNELKEKRNNLLLNLKKPVSGYL